MCVCACASGTKLRELFIRRNKLTDFSELAHLAQLKNLKVIVKPFWGIRFWPLYNYYSWSFFNSSRVHGLKIVPLYLHVLLKSYTTLLQGKPLRGLVTYCVE